MHKESVEQTNYEDDLARQTNTNRQYSCLSTTNKLVQPASFGHSGIPTQILEQNN